MTPQEKWEAEAAKVKNLSKFNKNAKAVLLVIGVALTLAVVTLYNILIVPFDFEKLASFKTIIVSILAGFGMSAAATGMITSIYAGRVNVELLGKPPDERNYIEAQQLLLKLEEAKKEMKHYFEVAAVLLFLNAFKDIVDLFIV